MVVNILIYLILVAISYLIIRYLITKEYKIGLSLQDNLFVLAFAMSIIGIIVIVMVLKYDDNENETA